MTAYDYRQDFPLLRENKTVYIDNAATAQRPDLRRQSAMLKKSVLIRLWQRKKHLQNAPWRV